ncbi:MAG TPA: formyltransferase family protein, partial [Spirochaetales bacterium]|nr:formyltransferase family protein [Spirochaetales bacterium]
MRILFAGTAEIAIPSLKMIADTYELVAILTSPDAPQGRGLVLTPSPVALTAASYCPHVPVLKPQRLNQEVREQIRAYKPDVLVVYAYGKIFGPKFLSLFS